jgi:nucleoside-diphosphate-sugar epimerase
MKGRSWILVTGASGNIGGEVVAQLRAAGLPVRALSRKLPIRFFNSRIRCDRFTNASRR